MIRVCVCVGVCVCVVSTRVRSALLQHSGPSGAKA